MLPPLSNRPLEPSNSSDTPSNPPPASSLAVKAAWDRFTLPPPLTDVEIDPDLRQDVTRLPPRLQPARLTVERVAPFVIPPPTASSVLRAEPIREAPVAASHRSEEGRAAGRHARGWAGLHTLGATETTPSAPKRIREPIQACDLKHFDQFLEYCKIGLLTGYDSIEISGFRPVEEARKLRSRLKRLMRIVHKKMHMEQLAPEFTRGVDGLGLSILHVVIKPIQLTDWYTNHAKIALDVVAIELGLPPIARAEEPPTPATRLRFTLPAIEEDE